MEFCKICKTETQVYKSQKCIICYLIHDYHLTYDDIYIFIKNDTKLSSLIKDSEIDIDDEDCEYLVNMYDDFDMNIISNPIFKALKNGFKSKNGKKLHTRLKTLNDEFHYFFLKNITKNTEKLEDIDLSHIDEEDRSDLRTYFFNNPSDITNIEYIINHFIRNINLFLKDCKKYQISIFKILLKKQSLSSCILSIMMVMKCFELISVSYDILNDITKDTNYFLNQKKEKFITDDKIRKRYNTILQILKTKNEKILNSEFFEKVFIKKYNQEVYVIKYEYDKIKDLKKFFENDSDFCSPLDKDIVFESIRKLEEKEKKYPDIYHKLNEDQINGINMILDNKTSIITGGPGTGKSTLVSFLVSCSSKYEDLKFLILAPTGKASARMKNDKIIKKEINDPNIHTIHGYFYKSKKEKTKTDYNMIIIDESSMLSYVHMSYIKNILQYNEHDNYHIVFVGDDRQLPPIGLGDIFHNLLLDENISKYKLQKNNRSGDGIIEVLTYIEDNNNIWFNNSVFNSPNIHILTSEDFIKNFNTIYTENKTIQLITHKKDYKINQTKNKIFENLQKFYRGVGSKNSEFFEKNDRVYNKKNLYFKDFSIMNGFSGTITKVKNMEDIWIYHIKFDCNINKNEYDEEDENNDMVFYYYPVDKLDEEEFKQFKKKVNFIYDELLLNYIEKSEIDKWIDECYVYKNIEFSYIMSIHKYQGSECENIVYYVDNVELYFGIDKKLVYTALSRAKKNLFIVLQNSYNNPKLKLKENDQILFHNDVF